MNKQQNYQLHGSLLFLIGISLSAARNRFCAALKEAPQGRSAEAERPWESALFRFTN